MMTKEEFYSRVSRGVDEAELDARYHRRLAIVWGVFAVLFATMAVYFLLTLFAGVANAGERPCGTGGNNRENRQLARCLSHQPGINVNRATAISVGNCESGFNRHANSGTYKGIYQLGTDEFNSFQHQGPRWVDREFRQHNYGIFSARGNILAAFAHAHDHGWGAWSCA
jgi:hypothetical protein